MPESHTYAAAPFAAPPPAGGTTATPAGAANMDAWPSSSRCPLAATYDPAYGNETAEATPSEPVTFPSSATRRTRFVAASVTSSVRRPGPAAPASPSPPPTSRGSRKNATPTGSSKRMPSSPPGSTGPPRAPSAASDEPRAGGAPAPAAVVTARVATSIARIRLLCRSAMYSVFWSWSNAMRLGVLKTANEPSVWSRKPFLPALFRTVKTPAPFGSPYARTPRTRPSPSATYKTRDASWYARPVGLLIWATIGSSWSKYPSSPLPANVATPPMSKSTTLIRLFPASATNKRPSALHAKPRGSESRARVAAPSTHPAIPEPTTVVTTFDGVTLRMRWFPLSATYTSPVAARTTTPDGARKALRSWSPSRKPGVPSPATVVTEPSGWHASSYASEAGGTCTRSTARKANAAERHGLSRAGARDRRVPMSPRETILSGSDSNERCLSRVAEVERAAKPTNASSRSRHLVTP